MPAVCGALDGALAGVASGGGGGLSLASGRQLSVSQPISGSGRGADAVLRDTRPRLEGLFAAAAAKDVGGTAALPGGNGGEDGEGDETGGDADGTVLGTAGLRTLLAFPAGAGLVASQDMRVVLDALLAGALRGGDADADATGGNAGGAGKGAQITNLETLDPKPIP